MMPRLCGHAVRLQTLWMLWYAALGFLLHAYMIYRASARCVQFWTVPWPPDSAPVTEMITLIVLIAIASVASILFFISAVVKVDNYANDNVKLGRENVGEELKRASLVTPGPVRTLWQYAPPTAASLHLLISVCLLLPSVFLDATEIRHGFRHHGYAWVSNMDFLYGPKRISTRLTFNFSSIIAERMRNNMTVDLQPVVPFDGWQFSLVTPEYANWVFAMIVFAIRYATVFWSSSRLFSSIFSLQIMSVAINSMFTFCGISILYKFKFNEDLFYYPKITLVLPHVSVLVLFVLFFLVMCCSTCVIFTYGYNHYKREHDAFMTKYRPPILRPRVVGQPTCYGYTPHILATAILILIVSLKAPLLTDYMNWYRHTRDRLILSCVVVDACYMLFWIILWFGFTLKHDWKFKIKAPSLVMTGKDNKMNVYTIQNSQSENGCRESVSSCSPRSSVQSSLDSSIVIVDGSSREGSTIDLLPMPRPREISKNRKRTGRRTHRGNLNPLYADGVKKSNSGDIMPPLQPETMKEARLRMLHEDYKRRSACSDPGPSLTPQQSDVDSCNDSEQDLRSEPSTGNSRLASRERGGPHYPRRTKAPPVIRTLSLQTETKYSSPMIPISENMELKDFRSVHAQNNGPNIIYQNQINSVKPLANGFNYTNTQLPGRQLNRDIKIVTKPDANRRDSGAPSSQETSSNDSGDNNNMSLWSRV